MFCLSAKSVKRWYHLVFLLSLNFASVWAQAANSIEMEISTPTDSERILEELNFFIKEALEQKKQAYPEREYNFKISGLNSRLSFDPCLDRLTIHNQQDKWQGRTTFKVGCPDASWSVYVSVYIQALAPVVVAKRSLPKQTLLTEAHLARRMQDLNRLRHGYFTQIADAVGLKTRYPIGEGDVLKAVQLERPLVVEKGDRVVILARNAALEVKMKGEALEDGYINEQIQVKNLNSGRIIRAFIRSPGVVEVIL